MKRSLAAIAFGLSLLAGGTARAQSVTVDLSIGGSQSLTIRGPARITYSGSVVVVNFGPGPTPVPPDPTPVPPIPPAPDPPAPTWGPLDRIVILYESAKTTGREPIYSTAVRDSMSAATPTDSGGLPRWRVWDKDAVVPAADHAAPPAWSPEWAAALTKAKSLQAGAETVNLYAFDAAGEVKTVPLSGLTDAEAIKAIKALGASK